MDPPFVVLTTPPVFASSVLEPALAWPRLLSSCSRRVPSWNDGIMWLGVDRLGVGFKTYRLRRVQETLGKKGHPSH